MTNPHNLHFDERVWLEVFAMLPILFTMFPVPLGVPVLLICMAFDKPANWPVAAIYFTWLAIGVALCYLNQKENDKPL